MARWNALPPRNAAHFAPPTSETLPIVLLAHDRELYLRPGLRLWAAVKGIEQAVLVASHHGTHEFVPLVGSEGAILGHPEHGLLVGWEATKDERFVLARAVCAPGRPQGDEGCAAGQCRH